MHRFVADVELVGNFLWDAWSKKAHGDYRSFESIVTERLGLLKVSA